MGECLNKHLTEKDRWKESKHMKRCFMPLTIRLSMKTAPRGSYPSTRTTEIKSRGNTQCWQGYGENGMAYPLLTGMESGTTTLEIVWQFPDPMS